MKLVSWYQPAADKSLNLFISIGWLGPMLQLDQRAMGKLEQFIEMHISLGLKRTRPANWVSEGEPSQKQARTEAADEMDTTD